MQSAALNCPVPCRPVRAEPKLIATTSSGALRVNLTPGPQVPEIQMARAIHDLEMHLIRLTGILRA